MLEKKMTSVAEDSWRDFMDTLSTKNEGDVLSQIKCPLLELLDNQANIDQAKKALFKPEIGQLLKLYLSAVSLDVLSDKMTTHEKIFKRAFGIDKFNHLKLLVKLKSIVESKKPKKGLLAS